MSERTPILFGYGEAGAAGEHVNGYDRREVLGKCDARYLAGIFEIGGGMSIRPDRKTNPRTGTAYCGVRSKIYFNDSNSTTIVGLQKRYGGIVIPLKKENSWRWYTEGQEALEHLRAIRPYAPFRAPQIGTFELTCSNLPIEDRVEIAEQFTDYVHGVKNYPDPSSYKEILSDPHFLAGMYAGRGANYEYEKDNRLRFNSQNISLMTAFGDKFGVETVPTINTRWPRDPQALVPVSFIVQLHGGTMADFLDQIQQAA